MGANCEKCDALKTPGAHCPACGHVPKSAKAAKPKLVDYVITLRLKLDHFNYPRNLDPRRWDWKTLLDLEPGETVEVLAVAKEEE